MFENVISLGCNCLVAAAMNHIGVRSCTGPFDWCISDFLDGIIPAIENNFDDFIKYENLEYSSDKRLEFYDKKYNILFNHDIKDTLDSDYDSIVSKYDKVVNRFLADAQNPTLFIRGCWSALELQKIAENEKRILKAISQNSCNEIIIVVPKYIYDVNPIQTSIKVFPVDVRINGFDISPEEASHFFDSNPSLVSYIVDNYPTDKRKDNIIFGLQSRINKLTTTPQCAVLENDIKRIKENLLNRNEIVVEKTAQNESLQVQVYNLKKQLDSWMNLENIDFSKIDYPNSITIYGCGARGKILYQKIKSYVKVNEILDSNPKQDTYLDIPVRKPCDSNISYHSSDLIVVIPSRHFNAILSNLKELFGNDINVITIEDFINKGPIIDPLF